MEPENEAAGHGAAEWRGLVVEVGGEEGGGDQSDGDEADGFYEEGKSLQVHYFD